ncbi:MAG: valine--tRNA ligase [Bdellovibrionales bacterium]|nr:valine--tRNA ligase [Bdellovibrionales bacterium]
MTSDSKESRELSDRYNPSEVESRLYKWWEESGFFHAEESSTKPPFCIILPPPNVTGHLHLGHALNQSVMDCLCRWKRMSGYNVLWLPGTDHAGIATQSVVEKKLLEEGTNRKDLGREKFLEQVWAWKEQYGNRICEQTRRMGSSLDWERQVFTLDEGVSKAVTKVFVDLYKQGLIYRGTRLINWSSKLESALSDLEVEYKDVKGSIWHIRYPLADGSGSLVVATTRPETMLGDTAVAVHPLDERYKDFIGKEIALPLTNRKIKVIADEYVDREFGSGAVKITPAHDFNDYEMGKRHNLQFINILNRDGSLNEQCGEYQGLKVNLARKKVIEDLEAKKFLVKVEPHQHSVGHCEKSGCVVEPFLSEQWFLKMQTLADPAMRVAESGTVKFEPENWTKTYLHWLHNIQDWCVSRQLWWGHRIPAWYCDNCDFITVSEKSPKECGGCKGKNLRQDEDVLDTWFSSQLWPFTTMGWPEENELQKTFYPTDILVTGHDIIFFWVARMIMAGLKFKGDVPFRTVYLHGLIRDSQGRKMSKSLGNSVDPVEVIEGYGADALRFTLLSQIASGRDLKFSQQRLEGNRNFMNKIWNAARFTLSVLEDFEVPEDGYIPSSSDLSAADRWIVYKTGKCEDEVHKALQNHRFSDAANAVYSFAWHEFCDWYLEFIKPIVYGENASEKKATQLVLAQTINRLVRLLHPFIPFISEEIYQKLPIRKDVLMLDSYPTPSKDKAWLAIGSEQSALEMDLVREVITAIRNIRGENRIKPGVKLKSRVAPKDDKGQKIVSANRNAIMSLARLEQLDIQQEGSLAKCAVTPVSISGIHLEVVVPLEGLVDFDEEIKRLTKVLDKVRKESAGISKRLSNENFLKNAPEDVVELGKKQIDELSAQIKVLEGALERFR